MRTKPALVKRFDFKDMAYGSGHVETAKLEASPNIEESEVSKIMIWNADDLIVFNFFKSSYNGRWNGYQLLSICRHFF